MSFYDTQRWLCHGDSRGSCRADSRADKTDLPIARALQAAIHVLEKSPGLRVRAHEVPLAVRENLVIASPHLALGRVCVDFERRHEPGRDRRKVCTRWGHIPQAFLLERSLSSMEHVQTVNTLALVTNDV